MRRAVSDLCKALVCNYPELLLRPHTTMHLRPIGAGASMHYSWRLTDSADGVILSDAPLECPAHPVEPRYDCKRRARADVGNRDFRFHDHPALSRIVQLHISDG